MNSLFKIRQFLVQPHHSPHSFAAAAILNTFPNSTEPAVTPSLRSILIRTILSASGSSLVAVYESNTNEPVTLSPSALARNINPNLHESPAASGVLRLFTSESKSPPTGTSQLIVTVSPTSKL